jgi:hypothetical protein
MGWGIRGNQRYYYRAKKVNGKCVQTYFGNGPVAEIEAEIDAQDRLLRIAKIEAHQNVRARLRTADEPLLALGSITDLVSKATLVTAGYYQHDGGEWRIRRIEGHG